MKCIISIENVWAGKNPIGLASCQVFFLTRVRLSLSLPFLQCQLRPPHHSKLYWSLHSKPAANILPPAMEDHCENKKSRSHNLHTCGALKSGNMLSQSEQVSSVCSFITVNLGARDIIHSVDFTPASAWPFLPYCQLTYKTFVLVEAHAKRFLSFFFLGVVCNTTSVGSTNCMATQLSPRTLQLPTWMNISTTEACVARFAFVVRNLFLSAPI